MLNIEKIAQKFKSYSKIETLFNENLSARTSFKIGGPAAILVEPADIDSLCFAMNTIRQENIPFFVLGGGTNCVFADEGFEGVVVSMRKLQGTGVSEKGTGVRVKGEGERVQDSHNLSPDPCTLSPKDCTLNPLSCTLSCSSGTSMNSVVNFATENGLSGLEEFAGLPGTVGGAVYMNARCFEKEISDVAQKIFWIEYNGTEYVQKEKVFSKEEWGYKKSPFTDCNGDKIITGVEFAVLQGTGVSEKGTENAREAIAERCKNFVQQRKDKGHFEYPCAGSVFKNNRAFGEPSGKIIEGLGLKGKQIGGAQIAPFHGNIIINVGSATCKDVQALVELIKKEAKAQRGFDLEEEIIFVN